MTERCDVPEIGAFVILPVGTALPSGFDRPVLFLDPAMYVETIRARGEPIGVSEPTDDLSPAVRKAMQRAAKGLHKVDVRAMRERIFAAKADGSSDDDLVKLINRGEAIPEFDDALGG